MKSLMLLFLSLSACLPKPVGIKPQRIVAIGPCNQNAVCAVTTDTGLTRYMEMPILGVQVCSTQSIPGGWIILLKCEDGL
jgi:hypothetical protein